MQCETAMLTTFIDHKLSGYSQSLHPLLSLSVFIQSHLYFVKLFLNLMSYLSVKNLKHCVRTLSREVAPDNTILCSSKASYL